MKVMIGSAIWRNVEARHISSLVQVLRLPNFSYGPSVGDALIERARGMNATWFLNQTDADVHMSIDSDICDFKAEDVQKVCEQAMTHDIVCGLYVTRAGNQRPFPTTFVEEGIDVHMGTDKETLVPVKWGATGFMATHRRVFEKLAESLTLLQPSTERAFYNFYHSMEVVYNGEPILLSEDYAFTQRAKDAGFGVWANPGVRLGHVGPYPYRIEDMGQDYPDPQPVVIRREDRTWSIRPERELAAEAELEGVTHAENHKPRPTAGSAVA